MLFGSLKRLSGYDDVRNNLWEKASKASPRDLNIQTRWFNFAYENSDWKSAQKVSLEMQVSDHLLLKPCFPCRLR